MGQCQLQRLVSCTLADESSSVVLGRMFRHYSKEVSLEWVWRSYARLYGAQRRFEQRHFLSDKQMGNMWTN